MLIEIGEGRCSDERVHSVDKDPASGSTYVRLPLIEPVTDQDEALAFIYPNGFDHETIHKSLILASTNEEGNTWNATVQAMNPESLVEYLSADVFDPVDDPVETCSDKPNKRMFFVKKRRWKRGHRGDEIIVARMISAIDPWMTTGAI